MLINFLFVGEGSSDDGIISHLESLCIDVGATEVSGVAPDFRRLPASIGRTVEAKIKAAIKLEPEANLVFVHRDADSRDSSRRYREIASAAEKCGCVSPVVCVVPIQATEAWLLLDEAAIRRAVGRPDGGAKLKLPRPEELERMANPKEELQKALELASEATGRRLEKIKRSFGIHRRTLLRELTISGELNRVHSWNRLRRDLKSAYADLLKVKLNSSGP